MLATTFGLFGGLGGLVALITVLAFESFGIRWILQRFRMFGVFVTATGLSVLAWSFFHYARPWMLFHFGEIGYWLGVGFISAPIVLFFYQAVVYVFRVYNETLNKKI